MATTPKPAGPAPDRARLHERALTHLSRFAATEAGLARVLDRAVQRWAQLARRDGIAPEAEIARARAEIPGIVAALVQSGVLDEAGFATARVRRLVRGGRSRRATAAHLAAKGVRPDLAEAALADAPDELQAAVAYVRKRRLGPFRTRLAEADPARDLAALARAGFPRSTAERALSLDPDAAEAILLALRQA